MMTKKVVSFFDEKIVRHHQLLHRVTPNSPNLVTPLVDHKS